MRYLMRALCRNLLEKVSLAYIFLPCFLFVGGWLKPVFSIPVCAVLAAGLCKAVKSFDEPFDEDDLPPVERQNRVALVINCVLIAALVTVVVVYSGIGAYGHQIMDYAMKHNSFMKDFLEYSWPLGYAKCGPRNEAAPMVTYIAFYLPSAFVGKLLGPFMACIASHCPRIFAEQTSEWWGWNAANLFSLAWAIVGVCLIMGWCLRIVGKVSVFYALIFLFFGGLEIVGWVILTKSFFPARGHPTMSFWMGYGAEADPGIKTALNGVKWFYQSDMTFLYQSCHHMFPGSIILLMIVYYAMRRRSVANMGLLWAATPLGSVFVAIGMAPFLLVSLIEARMRRVFTFQNVIAAPVLLLVIGFFFLSNRGEYPHGWLWKFQDLRVTWLLLLIFYIIEFGAYAAVCPRHLSEEGTRPGRIWWWTAIACLLLLPWYRLGKYSDLSAKAALPSLLILQIYLAATIRNAKTPAEKNAVRLLVLFLIIGSFGSINELTRGLGDRLHPPPPYQTIRHVNELPGQDVAAQLFGDGNAFFWKYLAKPVDYQDGVRPTTEQPGPAPATPEGQWTH